MKLEQQFVEAIEAINRNMVKISDALTKHANSIDEHTEMLRLSVEVHKLHAERIEQLEGWKKTFETIKEILQ